MDLPLDDLAHCLPLGSWRGDWVLEDLERVLDRGEQVSQLVRQPGEEPVLGLLFATYLCAGLGQLVVCVAQAAVQLLELARG